MSLTAELKALAAKLGFQLAGCAPAVTPAGLHHLYEWLANGYAGEMHYFESRKQAYQHPRFVLDGAKSLLVLGMNYANQSRDEPHPGQGKISNQVAMPIKVRTNACPSFRWRGIDWSSLTRGAACGWRTRRYLRIARG